MTAVTLVFIRRLKESNIAGSTLMKQYLRDFIRSFIKENHFYLRLKQSKGVKTSKESIKQAKKAIEIDMKAEI